MAHAITDPTGLDEAVTLYGAGDELDAALAAALAERGARAHALTVPLGWLSSTRRAVVRADTAVGARAISDLSDGDCAPAMVVVVAEAGSIPFDDVRRLRDLCARCADLHGVWLIWYPPIDGSDHLPGPIEDLLSMAHLADLVVDHLQAENRVAPSAAFHELAVAS